MRKILYVFFIFAIPFLCNAGNFIKITGKVTDKQSKLPIPMADVYISGNGFGTITNDSGEFIFKIPLVYKNVTWKLEVIIIFPEMNKYLIYYLALNI